MYDTFLKFMEDKHAAEMFISGQAGTGKTTSLSTIVRFCIDNNIPYVVAAHTHKACGILKDKLPEKANITTTHAFLKKRPIVNEHATKVKHIQNSTQQGTPEDVKLMLLDEYSQLGEKDYSDIGDKQYTSGTDIPDMKVIYIGDPNQIPPVGDTAAIYPTGKYNVKLTKIWRQAEGNPLLGTLTQLVNFIEGAKPEPLIEHKNFMRGTNLLAGYVHTKEDKVLLAFTNERVQELNALVAGKEKPECKDQVFSPTTKHEYTFIKQYPSSDIDFIDLPFGDEPLGLNTKYKTLEHLLTMPGIRFALLDDELGGDHVMAYIFGHYKYKIRLEELGKIAVKANKVIEDKYKQPAKQWAFANKGRADAKKRAKAWRDYFTFKNCVICLDFPYAMTVHKSQGSTFHTVFLDTKDLGKCADKDYMQYLKLMYVGISRASHNVYTN